MASQDNNDALSRKRPYPNGFSDETNNHSSSKQKLFPLFTKKTFEHKSSRDIPMNIAKLDGMIELITTNIFKLIYISISDSSNNHHKNGTKANG